MEASILTCLSAREGYPALTHTRILIRANSKPEKVLQPFDEPGETTGFTFPDRLHLPAQFFEFPSLTIVSFYIRLEFRSPELVSGFGFGCAATTGVSVPKAPVDENRLSSFGEGYVR